MGLVVGSMRSWLGLKGRKHSHLASRSGRRRSFEMLEERRLLAINWTNAATNNFGTVFGADAPVAVALVNRAIADWEDVIADFNYDNDSNPSTVNFRNNTYNITISGGALNLGERGRTENLTVDANGRPYQSTVTLDNDAGSAGWFFDHTPLDDAEFTGIANSFQSSFVNSATSSQGHNDFYRTILHEIGHAVGIFLSPGFRLFSLTSPAGVDQVDVALGAPNPGSLRRFHNPSGSFGVTATFTTNGGGHSYEGPVDASFPTAPTHPNELMNPGRTVPPPGASPNPTTRQFISDLTAQVLADAYGYAVVLPSSINTSHATLDDQTGVLLVQGGLSAAGAVQNDTITVDVTGVNIRVQVNGTTELVPQASVNQIVIAGNGGTDTITVDSSLAPLRKDVHYVVSSNEDSANAGTLGDGIVDLDAVVPGRQVALRAAVRDANGTAGGAARSIYVPRGNYVLSLAGSEDHVAGNFDLDVEGNVTIIGAGAGATVIEGGWSTASSHTRLFEVRPGGTLNLSQVTLTGGNISGTSGGAIRVGTGTLNLSDAALVGNAASAQGGAIYSQGGNTTIERSVITANTAGSATNGGGGVYAGNPGSFAMGSTIVAGNTANGAANNMEIHVSTVNNQSLGNNILGTDPATTGDDWAVYGATGDVVESAADYIVTSLVDTNRSTLNAATLSVREAVMQANAAAGADTILLPA